MSCKERKVLSIEEDYSVGYSIQFTANDDKVHVEIENPWSGDSETGFGQTAYIDLSKEGAEQLLEFLTNYFNEDSQ